MRSEDDTSKGDACTLNQVKLEDMLLQASEEYHLTEREKEIIGYWMKDFNYREIALLLGISQNTVKVHISRINLKLNVNSKASLILRLIGHKHTYAVNEARSSTR